MADTVEDGERKGKEMLKVENNKIYMVRGDDEVLAVALDGYEMAAGDMLTLTVRETPTADSQVLLQISGAPGSNRIVISHADTAEAAYGAYSADVQLLTADGLRKTVWPTNITDPSRLRAANMKNFMIVNEVTV